MQISSINNYSNYRFNNFKKNNNDTTSFKSLFADAKPNNMQAYANYATFATIMGDSDYMKLKGNSTRIFRELPVQNALTKILNPNKKTQINILGCSDGSEAYAYAIALKEAFGDNAVKNFNIQGIDFAPYVIDIAKTGCMVCSDVEKNYANDSETVTGVKSPLAGSGWDKYLEKTTRPKAFEKALAEHSCLSYAENDPVVEKTIGDGLEWYKVNTIKLPKIDFKTGDMFDYLNSNDDKKTEMYVIANAAGYMLQKNPKKYVEIFEKIKKANSGKNKDIYVIVGDLENIILSPMTLHLDLHTKFLVHDCIKELGYKNIDTKLLNRNGVKNPNNISSKIFTLIK